jgi:dTMP kinase
MARGSFITLEGGEGAGKSTQVKRLARRLEQSGIETVTTREPGGAPSAEVIRSLLVEGEPGRWRPATEALLHFAARHEHLHATLLPALDRGAWVVCDRFADSTMAYQGYGLGLGRDMIETLYGLAVGDIRPDFTLILDLPVEAGLARAKARMAEGNGAEDRYERMDHAFHERLRAAFLDIAKREPARCHVVDAAQDVDAVSDAIWAATRRRFGLEAGRDG